MALHVHEWGDPTGPPLLCLHGVTGHGARFRKLAEERLASFRVVAPDLRGHGRSEWEPPWRLGNHVDDLLATASRLGIERAAWLGHSFGGRLALEVGAAAPARVSRLVLLDPALWVPPPVALQRAEEAREEVSFATAEDAIEHRLASGTVLHTPRELLEEEVAGHLEPTPDGRLRFRYSRAAVVAAYGEMAVAPPLEAAEVQTLVVRGASSTVCPDALLDVLRAAVGELLESVDVPGGHSVLWDSFSESADAIERFLAPEAPPQPEGG